MEEIDTVLAYKDSYKIIQEKNSFSFSIDSTILSFFLDIKKRDEGIIDLGTGNGAIPLILALRTDKKIHGIELQEEASLRAKRSVELNHLEDRITIINDDIKNLKKLFPMSSFSIVLSNPPYFRLDETSFKCESKELTIARHETNITMEEIIDNASYLLKDGGSLSIVQRTDRFLEVMDLLRKYRLVPKRIRFVYPKYGKESFVFLVDARKNSKPHGLKVLDPLYIYGKDNDYSDEVKSYFHYGEKDEKIE